GGRGWGGGGGGRGAGGGGRGWGAGGGGPQQAWAHRSGKRVFTAARCCSSSRPRASTSTTENARWSCPGAACAAATVAAPTATPPPFTSSTSASSRLTGNLQ